jgi:hypothetical protein
MKERRNRLAYADIDMRLEKDERNLENCKERILG